MVICIVVNCGNRSERDKGCYSKLPLVRNREGEAEREISEERRRLWLKAISRDDLTEKKMRYQRVCFRHFVHG